MQDRATFVAPEEGLICKPKYRAIFCFIHFFALRISYCVFVSLTAVRISRSVYFFTKKVGDCPITFIDTRRLIYTEIGGRPGLIKYPTQARQVTQFKKL